MFKVKLFIKILFVMVFGAAANVNAQTTEAEIYTLFTTQQERELINKNRYRKQQHEVSVEVAEKPQQQQEVEREEVKLTLKLAGVTLSQSGQNVAWLNGQAIENGGELEDGSKVYISPKVKSLVQIKTPDGKYHPVTTGESIDISYFKPIEG